jgi:hypothetical protein
VWSTGDANERLMFAHVGRRGQLLDTPIALWSASTISRPYIVATPDAYVITVTGHYWVIALDGTIVADAGLPSGSALRSNLEFDGKLVRLVLGNAQGTLGVVGIDPATGDVTSTALTLAGTEPALAATPGRSAFIAYSAPTATGLTETFGFFFTGAEAEPPFRVSPD